jgi:LacI family transcriptional regulator
VREGNRLKVESVIKRRNFVPNYHARGLSNKQSFAVGLLVTSMSNFYYMEITESIERRLRERGYMLYLCSSDSGVDRERQYLNNFISRNVDGMIVIDPSAENHAAGLFSELGAKLPLVLVHSNPEIHELNSIMIDQRLGMVKVLDHLFGLGHRDIAFLRGRVGFSYDIKEDTWRGYLAERGFAPSPRALILVDHGNDAEAMSIADAGVGAVLGGSRPPTAIFACNDLMALGAVNAAARVGLRVPEELSIVSHDNTLLALSVRPRLSSVDLKMHDVGVAAVDLLLHAISDEDSEPRRIFFTPEFVIRESSAPAPAPVEQRGDLAP